MTSPSSYTGLGMCLYHLSAVSMPKALHIVSMPKALHIVVVVVVVVVVVIIEINN